MAAPGRLVGLDVARCLALLGMVAVHVLPDPDLVHELASGRASALFAVLAGVTLALITGRERPVRGRARIAASVGLAVRAVMVAVIGLALGQLDSGLAVILTYYGLLFLLGLPFVGLGWRALLVLAGAWAVAAPVGSHLLRAQLPEFTFGVPSFEGLDEPVRLLTELTFTGYYPMVPWLAYLLAGMAVGRMDLTRRTVAAALAAGGLVLAVAATAVSRWWADPALVRAAEERRFSGTTPSDDWGWLLLADPHSGTPFDFLQTTGSAFVVMGGCLLVLGLLRGRAERAVAVLFGAGTMTLTLYSLHVVLRTEPLWPPDDGTEAFRWHVLVLLWIGALFVAVGMRGPLESAVRVVSRLVAGDGEYRWSSRARR